jgi:hypothetical protein
LYDWRLAVLWLRKPVKAKVIGALMLVVLFTFSVSGVAVAELMPQVGVSGPSVDDDLRGKIPIDNPSHNKLVVKDSVFTGQKITPKYCYFKGKAYSISGNVIGTPVYGGNKEIGTGSVVIVGNGLNFVGVQTVSFKILPPKSAVTKLSAGKGALSLSWRKAAASAAISGYQVRYRSTDASSWKVKAYDASKGSSKITRLKKNKRYVVQVRAYKLKSGVNYYGAWSVAKTTKKIK